MLPTPRGNRPKKQAVAGLVPWPEPSRVAAANPPLRSGGPLRCLNRRDYATAVRDLTGLDIGLAPACRRIRSRMASAPTPHCGR